MTSKTVYYHVCDERLKAIAEPNRLPILTRMPQGDVAAHRSRQETMVLARKPGAYRVYNRAAGRAPAARLRAAGTPSIRRLTAIQSS
jgi:hypothetical protein